MPFRFAPIVFIPLGFMLPFSLSAQTFSDVKESTYEKSAIIAVLDRNWMFPQTISTFGYGVAITPDDWLRMLMFLRTSDACPELGMTANSYWTVDNIRACLAGAGVPVATENPSVVRRDEAMQQLFSLRRKSFAFQQLQTRPAGFVDPLDLGSIPVNRQGAMIAADRLKLIFRTKSKLLPALPLLREDAALSVWRFTAWEQQGGVETETSDRIVLSKEASLNHWRDLDTDIYVTQVKIGGDTVLRPILPRRSFNPAPMSASGEKNPKTEKVRDEFVYQTVSDLAKESGALAAVNGSYFNIQWPWGALEDVAIIDKRIILERPDRSTFIVCTDGKLFIGKFNQKELRGFTCTTQHALGAGPLFLTGGVILEKNTKEGFDEYTQWERRVGKNARTAIAISADRKTAYLIVVAGKSYPTFGRGGATLGAFLKEKYPDISEAMMFDGGGSSALYAQDKLLVGMGISGNTSERTVISAVGVFSKKKDSASAKLFKKEQAKRWDGSVTTIRIPKPDTPFSWSEKARKTSIRVADSQGITKTFEITYDRMAQDDTAKLIVTRREGVHEKGWNIPTEIHVIDQKDKSDTDIIRLFAYMPEKQKPDLKTFDAIAFRPSGVVFGDATGRYWFYYAKGKELSPAKFIEKPKSTKRPVKRHTIESFGL